MHPQKSVQSDEKSYKRFCDMSVFEGFKISEITQQIVANKQSRELTKHQLLHGSL